MIQVKSEGLLESSICLVGEAPGAQEVALRRPFVGQAGKVLDQILHEAGISRRTCYITNVFKERPHGNDISTFLKLTTRGVIETPKYLEHKAYLLEELNRCKAKVIVLLGAIPLYALTGKLGITKWRGSVLEVDIFGKKRKVIPTIHPAAVLRQYIYRYFVVSDMKKVITESYFPEVRRKERHLIVNPSYDTILAYLDEAGKQTKIGFDIETVNGEVSCFSIALSETNAISIPFTRTGLDAVTPEQELEILIRLDKILGNPNIVKVGQNIIFDFTFMYRKYGLRIRGIEDTMIAHGILVPEFPKGLAFITSMYTDVPYYKDDGKKYAKTGDELAFWRYNALDSITCMDAIPKLRHDLKVIGNLSSYERHLRLVEPLVFMHEKGVKVNLEGMHKASDQAEVEIAELLEKLRTIAGKELNPSSPKQLITYFYVEKKLKPYVSRKTGSMTTDETALKRIAAKGYEEAIIILEIRRLSKLKSTYYDMKIDEDERIRCSFNTLGSSKKKDGMGPSGGGTKSGRLSSSKTIFGTGGNMQNLPPEMLRFILADEGYVLYGFDLSQAENRTVAYIAPDRNMITSFESGEDIHKRTASLIFGKPIEEISNEPGSSPIGGGRFSERFWGKKANHGLNYGLGYRSFAVICEIQEKEAKFIVDRYHEAYPGVHQYHAWVKNLLSKGRTLEDCFGKRRIFFDRWGDDLFKEAYSYIPQSTVANIINVRGLMYIYYDQDIFRHVILLNQVHDSVIIEIPTSVGFEYHQMVLEAIAKNLETPLTWRAYTFSIPVDIKMGFNMRDMIKVKPTVADIERVWKKLNDGNKTVRS